jgi:hypothetical protein
MAEDLDLSRRIVGEPDRVEIEVDDAAGVEARGRDKRHREKRER